MPPSSSMLAEEAEPELGGPQQGHWMEQLERGARQPAGGALVGPRTARGRTGSRFGAALWRFWLAEGYLSEGRRWLDAILAGGEQVPERVRALEGMGWLAQYQGDIERAKAAYREMLQLLGSWMTEETLRPPSIAWVRWPCRRETTSGRSAISRRTSRYSRTRGRTRRRHDDQEVPCVQPAWDSGA